MLRGIAQSLGLFLIILLSFDALRAQVAPAPGSARASSIIHHRATLDDAALVESDCANGIDDDNNGLTDFDDYHCYFNNQATMEECSPSKIVWASSNWGLHWINLETDEQKLVAGRDYTFDDITWCANGKLYGAERTGGIFEISPGNYETTLLGYVDNHYYSNGMTADAQGNLFLTSFTNDGKCNVVKLNVATMKAEIIISLTDNMLRSSGDLCFMNGYLYVSCEENYLAKIDINKKTVSKKLITGLPITNGAYGMITLGEGYLYLSDNNTGIYKMDPSDMTAVFYKTIKQDNLVVLGFSSYPDLCNAPVCRGKVSIATDQFAPYCSDPGVLLTATGTEIRGESSYTWTLPGGEKTYGNTLLATVAGTYYVSYHTVPDTCGVVDSIVLDIARNPEIELEKNQLICAGSTIELFAPTADNITSMYWDDGSSASVRIIDAPGKYWIEVSNRCGLASDTVIVTERDEVKIFIGNDTMLCANTKMTLTNLTNTKEDLQYQWSDGSRNKETSINKPGTYVLEAATLCGTVTDTIVVRQKIDDCECFLYTPNAFTPDNDGKNDVFNAQSNCAVKGNIKIFNRWGGLVYSSADLSKGWNGFIGANGQPSGLYVYHISYEYVNRTGKLVKKGTITLIR